MKTGMFFPFKNSFWVVFCAFLVALLLRLFIFDVFYIPTNRMEPNLSKGDIVLGWRGLRWGLWGNLGEGSSLKRGQLVSFRFPGDEGQILVRRLVALPGDRISLKGGRLWMNGQPVELKTTKKGVSERLPGERDFHDLNGALSQEIKTWRVPQGEFFVFCDDRSMLDDSRSWGSVPVENIESHVIGVLFSISGLKPVEQ